MSTTDDSPSVLAAIAKILLLAVLVLQLVVMEFASSIAVGVYALIGGHLMDSAGRSAGGLIGLGATVLLIVVACAAAALVRQFRDALPGWRVLSAAYAVALPIGVWLAWDEAPLARPALPMLSADESSTEAWHLTLAYSSIRGAPPAQKPARIEPVSIYLKPDFAERVKAVREHRDDIERTWASLEHSERAWLADLNRHPRIGDEPVYDPAAPIMAFQPIRALCWATSAHAAVLAIDGKGDEAIAALLPILEVATKLEAESSTLVRIMVSRVATRSALDGIAFVLSQTAVSPNIRKKALAVLNHPVDPQELARRIVLVEFAAIGNVLELWRHGGHPAPTWWASTVRIASTTLLNPTATRNRWSEYCSALADLAARRDFTGIEQLEASSAIEANRHHLKNPVGWRLLFLGSPKYGKVIESHWKTDDMRRGVIATLSAKS